MPSRPRWTSGTRFTPRRVLGAVVLCAILPLCLLALTSSSLPVHSRTTVRPGGWSNKDSSRQQASSAVLRGTREVVDTHGNLIFNLPDRLKEDEFYLFSAYSAGFTNEVMTAINTVHMAILSGRTPILSFFTPLPLHMGAPDILNLPLRKLPFNDVFDVPRWFDSLRVTSFGKGLRGIVDVSELMEINGYFENGGLGWPEERVPPGLRKWAAENTTMRATCFNVHPSPRGGLDGTSKLFPIRIQANFTKVPLDAMPTRWALKWDGLNKYLHVRANETLVEEGLATLDPKDSHGRPSRKLACIDNLYFATADRDWAREYADVQPTLDDAALVTASSGVWATVGQYLHWSDGLHQTAETILRRVFGKAEHEEVPEFIAVHIRHGDFLKACIAQGLDCYSQSSFAKEVEIMQQRLLEEKGKAVKEVFLATNEVDPAFLEEAKERGWRFIDAELNSEIRRDFGDWAPTLIDSVILSMGASFVGSRGSTMSMVAGKRVEYWNGGLSSHVSR